MRWPAAALAVLAALAGCSDGKGGDGGSPEPGGPGALPMLHGFVFDPALRPLEGATVKVLDTNASTATGADGSFGFDGLPVDQFLVLVATKEGFVPASKQVTLPADAPVRLNFTLEPVPVQQPYSQVLPFEGFVECQAALVVSSQNNTFDCGAAGESAGLEDSARFEFAVEPGLAGAVVEVFWEAQSALAESMGARLETLELGQLNLVLGEVVGTSPLRITVPQSTAERYYPEGGLMRLTVYAAPNADENEAGVGASALVEQSFQAFASLFYVAPPDASYSVADA